MNSSRTANVACPVAAVCPSQPAAPVPGCGVGIDSQAHPPSMQSAVMVSSDSGPPCLTKR
ncbi:hypothetical protein GCM10010230_59350 [Streptomyces narbonensis]|nr:hypothetical protein GCM10010230_59350 [Streptomyces narbonensis]